MYIHYLSLYYFFIHQQWPKCTLEVPDMWKTKWIDDIILTMQELELGNCHLQCRICFDLLFCYNQFIPRGEILLFIWPKQLAATQRCLWGSWWLGALFNALLPVKQTCTNYASYKVIYTIPLYPRLLSWCVEGSDAGVWVMTSRFPLFLLLSVVWHI